MPELQDSQPRPLSVCFVGLQAYGMLRPSPGRRIAGGSVRAVHFARGIAALPHYSVIFGVRDEGQTPGQGELPVVTLPQWPPPDLRRRLDAAILEYAERSSSYPWIRFNRLPPKLLWQIPAAALLRLPFLRRGKRIPPPRALPFFRDLGAEILCVFGARHYAATAVASALEYGLRSVVFLVSDSDLEDDPRTEGAGFAVARADRVIAQTEEQRRLVAQRFGREAVLIRNPVDLGRIATSGPPGSSSPYALWIGRTDPKKRPELCVELARLCPEVSFVMVVNNSRLAAYRKLVRDAPPNVKIVDYVPFEEIDAYFAGAGVLVNTSSGEGFPNAFLEAGKHRVAVLSLRCDPDGFIGRHGCGLVAEDSLERLAAGLRRLWSDPSKRRSMGLAAHEYVSSRHRSEDRVRELDEVLRALQAG